MRVKLVEMSLSRSDAIDRCISLGKRFIEHFNKIYHNTDSRDVLHWLIEMQTWLDSINDITLKTNNKHLNGSQKRDWFYSLGSSYEEYFNEEANEIQIYEEFIDLIEDNRDVYKSIKGLM